ncbi:MAG: hypothetical protein FJX76_17595 [Armatimonadetes bacterium]|nr:hypothetical protein [Armatimonadota bacterium]
MPKDLRTAVKDSFDALDEDELKLITLAMLHGVPIRQLASGKAADDAQARMIGALKKLRAALDGAGCAVAQLR